MAKVVAKTSTAIFLASVFEGARKSGTATQDLVKIIQARKITWSSKAVVNELRGEFYLGRIAGSLGLDRVKADHVAGKIKHKPGANTDDRRTLEEERAYRAAKSAWSHVAMLAGQPNKVTGNKRAARQTTGTKQEVTLAPIAEVASVMSPTLTMPRAEKVADVHAFALRMRDLVTGYINQNAKMVSGPVGDLLRHFAEDATKITSA